MTENLNLPLGHFPRSCVVYVSVLYSRCCSGVVQPRVSKFWYIPGTSELYIHIGIISIIPSQPSLRASTTLYMHMEHKIFSHHPVKNSSGVLKGQRVLRKAMSTEPRGHPSRAINVRGPRNVQKQMGGVLIKPISGDKGVCTRCA